MTDDPTEYESFGTCPECGHDPLLKRPSDEKCPECDYHSVYGMRCNECLGELEVIEKVETFYGPTPSVLECTDCGAREYPSTDPSGQPP